MAKALFITGTGTDVGKTFVSALIVKKLRQSGLNAGYYKAALSGAEEAANGRLIPGDAAFVKEAAGIAEPTETLTSYIYRQAVSPHLAARNEGNPAELARIQADFASAATKYDYLTMEGSGGIVCPIRWDAERHLMLEDIVQALGLHSLIVADAGLGTINATVLTADYMRRRGLPLVGIILNRFDARNPMHLDNRLMVETLTGLNVVGITRENANAWELPARSLAELFQPVPWVVEKN